MRAVALLLVFDLAPASAFSSLTEPEQIESRGGNNDATYVNVGMVLEVAREA